MALVYPVEQTVQFEDWLLNMRDRRAAGRVAIAVAKLKRGLLSDWKSVGDGVLELRLEYGPGYRLYFSYIDGKTILLLWGGTKSKQKTDIIRARKLREIYSEEGN